MSLVNGQAHNGRPELVHTMYWDKKEKFLLYEDIYEDWIVFAVEDGSFDYEIGHKKGVASFGDWVICPPNIPFRRVVITPLTFHVLRLNWHVVTYDKGDAFQPKGKISFKNTNRLMDNYHFMHEANRLPEPKRTERIQHFIQDIWFMYEDENLYEDTLKDQANEQIVKDPLMQQAHSLIRQHAFEAMQMKEIASDLKISAAQLTKRFQAEYKMTPIQYLTSLRLEKVKQLLLETTLTIDQISECCGYQNGFYLSRIFAKHEQVTPSHYRKLHRI